MFSSSLSILTCPPYSKRNKNYCQAIAENKIVCYDDNVDMLLVKYDAGISSIFINWAFFIERNFTMFKHTDLKEGIQLLCDGKQNHVEMDVSYLKGKANTTYTIHHPTKETALLLIQGRVSFLHQTTSYTAERNNFFHDDAYCLHIPKNTAIIMEVSKDSEVLLQQIENNQDFPIMFYTPKNIQKQIFGDGILKATTFRTVTTIFDKERAPYSNMVLGEIINHPGIWSSYPPHSHPQPEVYFYKFHHPAGFGTCFIGDDCFKITNNSLAIIPPNKTHPQNAAPGYPMYYVWMIPHIPTIWKKTRILDPAHLWLSEEDTKIMKF